MLKILYQLDELDSIEHNLVADASNRLEVGEFQFFQLGYADWYGRDADTRLMEETFFAYMLRDHVPHWARHYARKIIQLDDEGHLDYGAPEYHRFDRNYRPPTGDPEGTPLWRRGITKFLVIALGLAILVAAMVIATLAVVPQDGTNCWYPPCHWTVDPAAAPDAPLP